MFLKLMRTACLLSVLAVVAVFSSSVLARELSVIVTSFPQYDLVSHITGDKASVHMLLKPGADAHSFEPTPQDIIAVQKSDLFVYNGGENDDWIEDLLEDYPSVNSFAFIKELPLLTEEEVPGMQKEKDGDHDDHEVEFDEHVFTSPKNDIKLLNSLCARIIALDPKNAEYYKKNCADYVTRFVELDKAFRQVVAESKSKTLIFADRFPFRYFCNDYGLTYFAAFKGCSDDSEVSPATLSFLVNKVKELHKNVILKIELTSIAPAQAVSEAANGVKIAIMNSGHNVSVEQLASHVSLADLYQSNILVLKEALN